jgi:hypothetical protein
VITGSRHDVDDVYANGVSVYFLLTFSCRSFCTASMWVGLLEYEIFAAVRTPARVEL